jgi:hypothetical protein
LAIESEGALIRAVTILILNPTATAVTVSSSMLGGGQWTPGGTPQLGQNIGYGTTYENGTASPYEMISGSVTFTPASGGALTLGWGWVQGTGIVQSSNSTSATLAFTTWVANNQTNFPTLNATIQVTA